MAFAALVPLSGESSHELSDRLVSLLREWDDDGSCTASRRDVQMALTALGLRVDLESLDGLFEAMSSDGRLRYDALGRLLKQGAARVDHYRDLDKLERLKLVMHDVDARLKAVRADVAAMAAAAAIDSELTERSRRLAASTAAAQTARQLGVKRPPLAHARTSPTACRSPSRAPAAAALAHACSLPSLVRSPGEAGPSAGGSPPAPRSGSPPPRRRRGRSYRKADMIRLSELRLPQVPRGSPPAASTGSPHGWAAIRAVPSPSTQRALNRKSSAVPRAFKVDMNSTLSVEVQVRDALVASGSRVMELFRNWDDDGDGEVSKAEFQRAMLSIGLCAPPEATGAQKSAVTEAVSSLFDSFDSDGGGTIGFRELNKMLRRTVEPPKAKRAEKPMIQVVSVPEARRASLISSRNVLANLQFPGDTVDPNIALLESIQPSEADLRRRKNSRDGIVADPLMFGIPSA